MLMSIKNTDIGTRCTGKFCRLRLLFLFILVQFVQNNNKSIHTIMLCFSICDLWRWKKHWEYSRYTLAVKYKELDMNIYPLDYLSQHILRVTSTMVALKGHHYISFSSHYINFDLCEKKEYDYVYIIIYTRILNYLACIHNYLYMYT